MYVISNLESNLVHGSLDCVHTLRGSGGNGVGGLEVVNGGGSSLGHLGGVGILGVELLDGNFASLNHGLLGLAKPDTGVVELLVGLVGASGVANLPLEVVVLVSLERTKAVPVGPLSVGIDVHLDDTILDGGGNLLVGGARSTVHDEVDGLLLVGAELLLGEGLVLAKSLGLERDIAGLVDAMDVAERGGDGEHVADLGEGLVHGPDLLGGGVELLGINILVVDTVLLATSDTDLHLEPDLHLDKALKVLDADGNVLFIRLLTEIKHVRGVEGLSVLLVVGLVGLKHTIEPGQELLGAVVRVKDDGDAVVRGHLADVEGHGDGTGGGGVGVLGGLASEVGSATVGDLDHDGAVVLLTGLHDGIAGGGAAQQHKAFVERSTKDEFNRNCYCNCTLPFGWEVLIEKQHTNL